MTASARLAKARAILAQIEASLSRAVALEALDAHRPVSSGGPDATESRRVVGDAIHRDLVVTLVGTIERGQERTASLGVLFAILADPRVVAELKCPPGYVERARAAYAVLHGEDSFKALRKLRDRTIAHAERGAGIDVSGVGAARRVLDRVLPVVDDVARALRDGPTVAWDDQRWDWARRAEAFWRDGPARH
jgi:hypothetical protein